MIRTKIMKYRYWLLFRVRILLYVLFILAVSMPAIGVEPSAATLPLLIETGWLEQNLNRHSIQIVEIGRGIGDYRNGHIPGASFFERTLIWDTVDGIPGMLPAVETVVEALEEAGISDTETVVIYDSGNALWASRLFWALEYFGHTDVHVLHGGWSRWIEEERRIESNQPSQQRAIFALNIQPLLLTTSDGILDNLDNAEFVVLDARSSAEYSGRDVRADRGGHIPGAINVDWVLNLEDLATGNFLQSRDLAEMYDTLGISRDKTVVTLCQTGVRAAHAYFALRLADFSLVSLYDGSWAEWGNSEDTPVVEGSNPR